MKQTIAYAGEELEFQGEYEDKDLDWLQDSMDLYREEGRSAACLHERGKHQFYVAPKEKFVTPVEIAVKNGMLKLDGKELGKIRNELVINTRNTDVMCSIKQYKDGLQVHCEKKVPNVELSNFD